MPLNEGQFADALEAVPDNARAAQGCVERDGSIR